MTISVVIPALNEAAVLGQTLEGLPEGLAEVIVADGGSRDGTRSIALAHGCRMVTSAPGRGRQMNAGAEIAGGSVLLFLHADTRLPARAAVAIEAALAAPDVVGGGFRLGIGSRDRFLHLVAATANLRTRLTGVPYGDQALFVRREVFTAVGGFRPVPIMEDVDFGRRLKRRGRVVLLNERVETSARRWERENPLYTTARNTVLVSLYLLGVAPQRLARWYRPVREEPPGAGKPGPLGYDGAASNDRGDGEEERKGW